MYERKQMKTREKKIGENGERKRVRGKWQEGGSEGESEGGKYEVEEEDKEREETVADGWGVRRRE